MTKAKMQSDGPTIKREQMTGADWYAAWDSMRAKYNRSKKKGLTAWQSNEIDKGLKSLAELESKAKDAARERMRKAGEVI